MEIETRTALSAQPASTHEHKIRVHRPSREPPFEFESGTPSAISKERLGRNRSSLRRKCCPFVKRPRHDMEDAGEENGQHFLVYKESKYADLPETQHDKSTHDVRSTRTQRCVSLASDVGKIPRFRPENVSEPSLHSHSFPLTSPRNLRRRDASKSLSARDTWETHPVVHERREKRCNTAIIPP